MQLTPPATQPDNDLYGQWTLTHPVDLGYACIMCERTDGELLKISSPRAWRIHAECCDASEAFNG